MLHEFIPTPIVTKWSPNNSPRIPMGRQGLPQNHVFPANPWRLETSGHTIVYTSIVFLYWFVQTSGVEAPHSLGAMPERQHMACMVW